ncbi:MAG: hypothetical protein A2122_01330 [Candidatus Liptonbacteria bacterium GWB1_49_6]|uniref:Fibronectin type-III domain-containing protein n=1 Tax=Candidatus Liptonbacteria bacterium GWB1_49_6 TaxID=1798644 RepID=A0A1G2C546_9BACT|nr:MAG: hypothetical protein A2122_01330 [Candidatus Liptonbacteria bacterium GWB1_49_6]
MAGGVSALPAKTHAIDTQAALNMIQELTKQIQQLQAQLTALKTQRQETTTALITTLREGSRGDAVKTLQAILAADTTIYPEGLITGIYGKLTSKAVARFQKKQGLPQVGNVGPKTLEKLKKELEEHPLAFESSSSTSSGDDDDEDNDNDGKGRPCAIVPPGHLIAPGWLRKHNGERPIVPECQTLPPGIERHLDDDDDGGTTTSTLQLSNISALAGSNSAVIQWNTSKPATGQVFYGTTISYGSSTALDSSLLSSHFQNISGLLPQALYHFMIESKTSGGIITATSTDRTFTTSPLADTTPPVISSISAGNITSSTATVSWATNELTSGRVLYGTSTMPWSASSTQTSLSALHSANLTGLTASTTYQFTIEAKDAVGNVGTSAQQSFSTIQ